MSFIHASPDKVLPARHKVRHRKVRQGQTIFKGHPSWNIMMNLKLGIAYAKPRHLQLLALSPTQAREPSPDPDPSSQPYSYPVVGGRWWWW